MSEKFPSSQTLTVVIPANGEIPIAIQGNYVRCLSSTGTFKLSPSDIRESVDMDAGLACESPEGFKFEGLLFRNETGVAITAKVFIGTGRFHDSRLNISGGLTITSSIAAPLFIKNVGSSIVASADIACAATAQTNLGGASSTNRFVLIKNPASSAGSVRIGGNTVAAALGYELEAGEGKEFRCTGNIFAYNPNTAPVTLSITYIRD
jgi:hypothetical protein